MSDADRLLLRHELRHALASIGPLHREAVVEVILRDRPYAEVAAELASRLGHCAAGFTTRCAGYGMCSPPRPPDLAQCGFARGPGERHTDVAGSAHGVSPCLAAALLRARSAAATSAAFALRP